MLQNKNTVLSAYYKSTIVTQPFKKSGAITAICILQRQSDFSAKD